MPNGVGILGGFEEVELGWWEEGNNLHEVGLADKTTLRLETWCPVKALNCTLSLLPGELTPTLEDVAWLTLLPLFGEANATVTLFEGEYQITLKYLIAAMTPRGCKGNPLMQHG